MFQKFLNIIKEYDSIVILRHSRPDIDALGSQLGLKSLIMDNFPSKKVFAIGDMARNCFLGEMDSISEDILYNSLIIISDVSVTNMMDPFEFDKFKKIIIFDHHKNETDIKNALAYYDRSAAAACQIVADFAYKMNLKVSKTTATCLYAGIITDSNRFNFSLSEPLFQIAGKLIDSGAQYDYIYEKLYNDKLRSVKMRAYFTSKFEVSDNGVGYMFNDVDEIKKFDFDFFSISRGMVNVMSNIEEVKIWCNFTINPDNNKCVCEFRSRNIPIVGIAKKYGGGGHDFACGATVENFEVARKILDEFNNMLK